MESTVKDLPKSKKEIKIKLPAEEFSPYLERGAKEVSKNLTIPGFRQGTAPRNVVEQQMGKQPVLEEGAKIALNEIFPAVVKEKQLQVLGQPQAKIESFSEEEGVEFSLEVPVLPSIELPDYKEIAKNESKQEVKVEDKEVQETLKSLQKSKAKYSKKSGAAEKGDQVIVDYKILRNNQVIEQGDIRDKKIILGEGELFPGLEEQLIGMKPREEKEVSLTAPSDFWEESLRGKKLTFQIKMKEIYNVELPAIDDEFAKTVGNFTSLEQLKNNIFEGRQTEKKNEEEKRWQKEVVDKIANQASLEAPEILVERERDQMVEDVKKDAENMGISFEEFLSQSNLTLEKLKEDLWQEAERRVKSFLCLEKIAEEENIQVSSSEVEKEINELLKQRPDFSSKLEGEEGQKMRENIKANLVNRKVMEMLANQQEKNRKQ